MQLVITPSPPEMTDNGSRKQQQQQKIIIDFPFTVIWIDSNWTCSQQFLSALIRISDDCCACLCAFSPIKFLWLEIYDLFILCSVRNFCYSPSVKLFLLCSKWPMIFQHGTLSLSLAFGFNENFTRAHTQQSAHHSISLRL